jgi:DNA gyrase/topoisomerase IV subunit B
MPYLFIREFIIETNDSQNGKNGKYYMQKFKNNMSVKNKPTLSKGKGKDFTQVKFIPDLKRSSYILLYMDRVILQVEITLTLTINIILILT